MNPETLILNFVENVGKTDFSMIITIIQFAFVAFWVVVLGWVWMDAGERTTNFVAKIASIILVGGLNIFGLIIYLIIRPKQTIQDLYWSDLERRYLKYETAELGDCERCKTSLQPGFNVCPNCGYEIKKQCKNCGVWVDKKFNYCPYCSASMSTQVTLEEIVEDSAVMEGEVNKSKEEAIKVVEGNMTKYVDRHGLLSKVKNSTVSFVKRVGQRALGVRKNDGKAIEKKEVKKKEKKNKKSKKK